MIINPSDYDKAFTKKIKSVFPNSVWATPDNAFAQASFDFEDSDEAKINFPLISFYRSSWTLDQSFYNEHSFRHGSYAMPSDELSGENLINLPIVLSYSLDIWGPDSDLIDTLTAEFIFMFYKYPNLAVEIKEPYPFVLKECLISINDVVENSEFSDLFNGGRLYRSTFDLRVSNAVISQSKDYKLVTSVPVKQITYKVDSITKKYDKI